MGNCTGKVWLFHRSLMFKAIRGLTPMYMTDNIVMAAETHDRDTRLSNSNDVNIPPHNSDVLKRSFIYNGSVIWNNLPDEIRMATDVSAFKWRYKCLILNPLFENEWCPFAYKVIENCVHFIRHFMPMFWVSFFTWVSFKLFVILLYHVPDWINLCDRAAWENSCFTECFYPV